MSKTRVHQVRRQYIEYIVEVYHILTLGRLHFTSLITDMKKLKTMIVSLNEIPNIGYFFCIYNR